MKLKNTVNKGLYYKTFTTNINREIALYDKEISAYQYVIIAGKLTIIME